MDVFGRPRLDRIMMLLIFFGKEVTVSQMRICLVRLL